MPLEATVGMGHTRWATHGLPIEKNAHPHLSQDGKIAIVYNGIIENFQELKNDLQAKGHTFISDTDTEVLAHLIGEECARSLIIVKGLLLHCVKLMESLCSSYAYDRLSRYDFAARMTAPLHMGIGAEECFVASDIPAFLPYTRDVVFLEDREIVCIKKILGQYFFWKILLLLKRKSIILNGTCILR